MGQDVQNPWERISAVPTGGDGAFNEDSFTKPEVALLDTQDMENMSDDDGWEFVNLGDQQSFGIKTAGLEENQLLVRCWSVMLRS